MLELNCQMILKHKYVIVEYNNSYSFGGGGEVDSNLRTVAIFVGCNLRVSHYLLSETSFRCIASVP